MLGMTVAEDEADAPCRAPIKAPIRTSKSVKTGKPTKRGILLPRQSELKTTIAVAAHGRAAVSAIARALELPSEIIRYHQINARILGLLDEQHRLTAEGAALFKLPAEPVDLADSGGLEDLQLKRLYYAFEASEVGRAWLNWAGRRTLDTLDAKTARAFLEHLCGAGGWNTTLDSHKSTLQLWCENLQAAHKELSLPSRARTLDLTGPPEPVAFDRGGSRRIVRSLAANSSRVDVATGYFNIKGYRELADNLDYADLRLLIGSDDDSCDQIRTLVRKFRESITQSQEMRLAEKREAFRLFRIRTIRARIRIRSLEARELGRLHAKIYLFDHEAAFITSANLTYGGLFKNIEGGLTTREKEQVEYYQRCFDELFEAANPIEERILREIERSNLLFDLQDPFVVYIKILLELFGSVEVLASEQRYQLAEFQKAMVAAVLTRLEGRRRLLLVAPTGIGKTVMAGYVAKVLMEQRTIARVIVVCKNEGMRENWEGTLRSFQITPDNVKVFELERTELDRQEPDEHERNHLEEVFHDLRCNDLVIVDECHHFRNFPAVRSRSLRHFLLGPAKDPNTSPYALLLTATPMSTDVENLNTLVGHASDERITDVADMARCEGAINLPLGAILGQFGLPGEGGYRALQYKEGCFYFPRLKIATRRYVSALTPIFRALSEYRGVLSEVKLDLRDIHELTGGFEVEAADAMGGITSGFLISLLARLAESSIAALTACLDGLLHKARRGELSGRDPVAVAQALEHLRRLTEELPPDPKLKALIEIVEATNGREKILIFSEFVKTVESIEERLRARFPGRRVVAITGLVKPRDRRAVLRRFAPEAQQRPGVPAPAAAKVIDILVASDAISEGENLQDARVVINFDLPWTPLKLIQRVGRVDRFTEYKRVVKVFNFFPEGEEYEQLVRLWQRLVGRDQQASTLSGSPSVGDHERIPDDLATGLMSENWLRRVADGSIEVGEWQEVGAPPPMSLLDILWKADPRTEAAREEAGRLPDGIQGMTSGPHPGLYVLLRLEHLRVALFRPAGEDAVMEAPTRCSHEHLLHRMGVPSTLPEAKVGNMANLDAEIDDLLTLRFGETRPERCQIVAALKILASASASGRAQKQGPAAQEAKPKPEKPRQLSLLE